MIDGCLNEPFAGYLFLFFLVTARVKLEHPDILTWRETDAKLGLWRPHFGFSGHRTEHIFHAC